MGSQGHPSVGPRTPLLVQCVRVAYLMAMLRTAYLSQKLDQPPPTKDGGTLRTIRDVEHIGVISDEMREIVQSEWPELAHKLPPKRP